MCQCPHPFFSITLKERQSKSHFPKASDLLSFTYYHTFFSYPLVASSPPPLTLHLFFSYPFSSLNKSRLYLPLLPPRNLLTRPICGLLTTEFLNRVCLHGDYALRFLVGSSVTRHLNSPPSPPLTPPSYFNSFNTSLGGKGGRNDEGTKNKKKCRRKAVIHNSSGLAWCL